MQEYEHSLALPFFGIGMKTPVATAEFSKFAGILSAALSQYHFLGFEIASFVHSDASLGPLDFACLDVWLQVSDHTIVYLGH